LVGVALLLEPLAVLEVVVVLAEELVEPDVVPVAAVVVPDLVAVLPDVVAVVPEVVVVVPEVFVAAVVVAAVVVAAVVVPDVVVPEVAVVVVPVRSTEPVAVPVDAETLVDDVDELSLELPPMEPQALRTKVQVRATDAVRNANSRAPAQLNRLNNIHPMQSSWLLNSL
jgi:hypothetical protein